MACPALSAHWQEINRLVGSSMRILPCLNCHVRGVSMKDFHLNPTKSPTPVKPCHRLTVFNRDFSSHSILPTISSSYLHHATFSSAISILLSLSTLCNWPYFPVCLFNNPVLSSTCPSFLSCHTTTTLCPCLRSALTVWQIFTHIMSESPMAVCPHRHTFRLFFSAAWSIRPGSGKSPVRKNKKTLHTGNSLLSISRMNESEGTLPFSCSPHWWEEHFNRNLMIFFGAICKKIVEKVRNSEVFCLVQLSCFKPTMPLMLCAKLSILR